MYQQSANDTVMMLLREPENCDAKLRATPRGAPQKNSSYGLCAAAAIFLPNPCINPFISRILTLCP